ncbi:MAG: hypothetical protein ACI9PP_001924 [Halobacteriales archaeon]|jgi:hypothetical protein
MAFTDLSDEDQLNLGLYRDSRESGFRWQVSTDRFSTTVEVLQ